MKEKKEEALFSSQFHYNIYSKHQDQFAFLVSINCKEVIK
jgi:hypothetical protein